MSLLIYRVCSQFAMAKNREIMSASDEDALAMAALAVCDGTASVWEHERLVGMVSNWKVEKVTLDGEPEASSRDTVGIQEPEMDATLKARRLLETDLRNAVEVMSFELHYQPQFNSKTKRITGFEALPRWTHPVRGAVPPSVFIPLAEEIGLIGRIGRWILEQACTDAAHWPGDICVAVNLSALQSTDNSLPGIVADALSHSKLSPFRLELEITETSMMADSSAAAVALAQLRATGVKIVLDNFGTGSSSLSHLSNLPFDKVKIDQSFIFRVGEGTVHTAIIRAIVNLCASLNVACLAEGVETDAQLAVLISEGCAEVQGHLLGEPGLAKDIPELLRKSALQPDPIDRNQTKRADPLRLVYVGGNWTPLSTSPLTPLSDPLVLGNVRWIDAWSAGTVRRR